MMKQNNDLGAQHSYQIATVGNVFSIPPIPKKWLWYDLPIRILMGKNVHRGSIDAE